MRSTSPVVIMAWSKSGLLMVFFVVTSGLRLAGSQERCIIQVDPARGLWSDVTHKQPASAHHGHLDKPYCSRYLYEKTDLTCTSTTCRSGVKVNSLCTLYYNTENQGPCLAACQSGCFSFQCYPNRDICPCMQDAIRYRDMCVPYECLKSCVGGYCDDKGTCLCGHGFKKEPNNAYKCVRIDCPDSTHTEYCQYECEYYGCNQTNGWCEKGECKCFNGFKKDPSHKYKCDRINCPDSEHTDFCRQKDCVTSGCAGGRCVQGECKCPDGKKYSSNGKCEPVRSQDSLIEECVKRCQDGSCNDEGVCSCRAGYQTRPPDKFVCHKRCSSNTNEDDSYYSVPEVPLKEFARQLENTDYGHAPVRDDGPLEEMEENILYQSFDFRPAVHRV